MLLGDICCYRSTRCSFLLTASHTTSGWRVPRDTWCCLWTALSPPALLLPSITLFMCVLTQPTANTDASAGFDATNGLYAFLKYIFRDIRKDRCGRIRRCEWRAVQGSEVIMSGVISSVSLLAKAYIMAVMMFKRTAGNQLHICECPPLCCQSIFLLWSEDRVQMWDIRAHPGSNAIHSRCRV